MSVVATRESESALTSPHESDACDQPARQSWISRMCSRLILSRLRKLSKGRLVLRFQCDEAVFGDNLSPEITGIINVQSPDFFRRVLIDGAMGAAESYLDGEWTSPDLTAVFRVLLQNEDLLNSFRTWRLSPVHAVRRWQHLRNRNSKSGSRQNIHEHYDLGNEFFSLFLDDSMMYSSAIFPTAETSLLDASWEKVDRVCRTLNLSPQDHVLEIGTGWGGFAFHAAKHFGCRVTTTTISEEQYRFAQARIEQAGLQDRVTLLKKDYRDLTGQYDKLVSLEMIEAVGREFLPEYFATCQRLVKPTGAMMLQAITMPEQRFDCYAKSVDFIQKYIFPGGFLPSVTEMQNHIKQQSDFRLVESKDFGTHYAQTLNHWNQRFHDRIDDVRDQGFSDRFIRMWRYYLCYCEAAFLERATGLVQAMWVKPGCEIGRLQAP